jgi:hypothetical protein
MLRYLENNELPEGFASRSERDAVLQAIRAHSLVRAHPVQSKSNGKPYILVQWTSHQLSTVGVRSILVDPDVKALLPDGYSDYFSDENFVVCKSLKTPIRNVVFNYSRVARDMSRKYPSAEHCPCRKFPSRFRPEAGCVLTGDLQIVTHHQLRKVLSFGPNFRDGGSGCAVSAIAFGLSDYVERMVSKSKGKVQASQFQAWQDKIIELCTQRIEQIGAQVSEENEVLLNADAMQALRKLQRHLVLVPMDKAANNIAFVCKALYSRKLRAELDSPAGAYEQTDESAAEILSRHRQFLEPKKLWPAGEVRLPFLYWMPKFHKQPVGARFIASAGNCSLTPCAKLVCQVLTFIMRTLRAKDNENIARNGVRRFFVVETFEEVTTFLKRWYRGDNMQQNVGLYSGDFSTMYTAIPQDDLVLNVNHAITEAIKYVAQSPDFHTGWNRIGVRVSAGGKCSWVRIAGSSSVDHNDKARTLPQAEIVKLTNFVVENAYVAHGSRVYRQTIGIPMGTNPGPVFANLYLYAYESRFIDNIEETQGIKAARTYHLTFRYIDDVLSLDNPGWHAAVSRSSDQGGIYPSALVLSKTSVTADDANFIGVRVRAEPGRRKLRLSVYDKRSSFPFHVRRYPLMCSLIPRSIPYGVFLGQLHRGNRICSDASGFVDFAVDVAIALRRNGCSLRRLRELFQRFVRKHVSGFKKTPHARLFALFSAGLNRNI